MSNGTGSASARAADAVSAGGPDGAGRAAAADSSAAAHPEAAAPVGAAEHAAKEAAQRPAPSPRAEQRRGTASSPPPGAADAPVQSVPRALHFLQSKYHEMDAEQRRLREEARYLAGRNEQLEAKVLSQQRLVDFYKRRVALLEAALRSRGDCAQAAAHSEPDPEAQAGLQDAPCARPGAKDTATMAAELYSEVLGRFESILHAQ